MRRVLLPLAIAAIVQTHVEVAFCASLRVGPAQFVIHNVQPGIRYDVYKETGLRLTVRNDDDVEQAWSLSTHRPSEKGKWETGYAEIPCATWCWFDSESVVAPAGEKSYAHLFLEIPDEERYYNQQWVVTLSVGGKASRPGLALAVDIRVQIETKAKSDVTAAPYGPLGVVPTLISIDGVEPGALREAGWRLFNNDSTPHIYEIGSLFDVEGIEEKTYLTSSYKKIPDSGWVHYEKRIQIEPGESVPLVALIETPEDAKIESSKWEEILLVRPDTGSARMVRLQMSTSEERDR